ncbi:MAG: IS1182 family transposase [Terriglobales bacterium]
MKNFDAPRILRPDRHQHRMEDCCLDTQLASEHRARQVWAFVESSDVSGLEERIKSRPGRAGAPAISPRLLLALWLYACLDGVGSARELSRLCVEHMAYRWLCGSVGVNHHTLSDFRSGCGEFLDGLLTAMIASLVKAGVIEGSTIFQDGTKVRASAGSSSFRREATLERLLKEAAEHVANVKAQAADPALSARVRAARERAAREREERLAAAVEAMKEVKQIKARAVIKKGAKRTAEARASTTDPEARVMKTGSGGKHPAYNVQFATDGKSRAIVGVQVLQNGVDNGMSEAMRPEVERRTGVTVKTHMTDAGYLRKETVEREEAAGVERIMPLPTNPGGEPATAHQPGDGPGVRQWRDRMQTEEAKALLRQRSGIAETPNAEVKTQRGLGQLLVRGVKKATSVVLMGAIVYNLMHFASTLVGQPMPSL